MLIRYSLKRRKEERKFVVYCLIIWKENYFNLLKNRVYSFLFDLSAKRSYVSDLIQIKQSSIW
jgi:hypothetical protein